MEKIDGVLLVNKPKGISSAGVVKRIKKIYKINKIGHTGTLDPFATGLLVCCLNKATKISNFFLNADKLYRGVLKLGVETDTQDSTGKISEIKEFSHFEIETLFEIICGFNGQRFQVPPSFSALKIRGVPLYKFARIGIKLKKESRPIFIKSFKVCNIELPRVIFEICCSSGTYIRSICATIGNLLGCGGHLESLHRLASGGFSVKQAYDFKYLEAFTSKKDLSNYVISMNDALNFIPSYFADSVSILKIRNGVKINPFNFGKLGKMCKLVDHSFLKVVDEEGALVAILENSGRSYYNYCCVF